MAILYFKTMAFRPCFTRSLSQQNNFELNKNLWITRRKKKTKYMNMLVSVLW